MNPTPWAPRHIHVARHGGALDVVVDGVKLPTLYVSELTVHDQADVDLPRVSFTLYANRITLDAANFEPDEGADDGDTQGQGAPQATEDGVRLPGTKEVPDP